MDNHIRDIQGNIKDKQIRNAYKKVGSLKADVVQRDALQLLGIRGWRRRAENRDEWRHLMREAKAWKGL